MSNSKKSKIPLIKRIYRMRCLNLWKIKSKKIVVSLFKNLSQTKLIHHKIQKCFTKITRSDRYCKKCEAHKNKLRVFQFWRTVDAKKAKYVISQLRINKAEWWIRTWLRKVYLYQILTQNMHAITPVSKKVLNLRVLIHRCQWCCESTHRWKLLPSIPQRNRILWHFMNRPHQT